MKKLIVIYIVSALCVCVLLYGVAAFCWWDINPAHWDSVTRFFVSIFVVTLAPCFSAFAVQLYKEFKEHEKWKLEHSGDMEHLSIPALDWLNKNHFDYRGLIGNGLANDATGLNIY